MQIIASTLLTKHTVTVFNIPDILDVRMLIELLGDMGVEITKHTPNQYSFKAENINLEYLISDEYKKKSGKLKVAVRLAGPLLARFKK